MLMMRESGSSNLSNEGVELLLLLSRWERESFRKNLMLVMLALWFDESVVAFTTYSR